MRVGCKPVKRLQYYSTNIPCFWMVVLFSAGRFLITEFMKFVIMDTSKNTTMRNSLKVNTTHVLRKIFCNSWLHYSYSIDNAFCVLPLSIAPSCFMVNIVSWWQKCHIGIVRPCGGCGFTFMNTSNLNIMWKKSYYAFILHHCCYIAIIAVSP